MAKRLEERMDASQIVRAAGMSGRPQFYSGRGAILTDLNSEILQKVYRGVEKAYGYQVAEQFVEMVKDMPKLSATDFLLTLYRLERHDWKWDKCLLGKEKGVYVDGETHGEIEGVFFATVAGVMFGHNDVDETNSIRAEFLMRHRTDGRKHY